MIKLRNMLVFSAVLGLALVANGEENKQIASNGQAAVAATAMTGQPGQTPQVGQNHMQQHKVMKQHHRQAMHSCCKKLDLHAVNMASAADLEKALKPNVAKRIIDTRTALGGKFESVKQFKKQVKLTKAQYKKLAALFPAGKATNGQTLQVKNTLPAAKVMPTSVPVKNSTN